MWGPTWDVGCVTRAALSPKSVSPSGLSWHPPTAEGSRRLGCLGRVKPCVTWEEGEEREMRERDGDREGGRQAGRKEGEKEK